MIYVHFVGVIKNRAFCLGFEHRHIAVGVYKVHFSAEFQNNGNFFIVYAVCDLVYRNIL